jgi:hypothetical protein
MMLQNDEFAWCIQVMDDYHIALTALGLCHDWISYESMLDACLREHNRRRHFYE